MFVLAAGVKLDTGTKRFINKTDKKFEKYSKIKEALQIKNKEIAEYLKLPPVKLHCSMLAEYALKEAIKSLQIKTHHDVK